MNDDEVDTHTHTHTNGQTDADNDNTRRPKLASDKDYMRNYSFKHQPELILQVKRGISRMRYHP